MVISILVACTLVDDPSKVDKGFLPASVVASPLGSVTSALSATGTYWNMDTSYQ